MVEINPQNVVECLHERNWLDRGIPARAEALAWGVSNVVLLVTPTVGEALVVKQSRAQLRTKVPWFSRLDRIFRETDAMRVIQPLLPAGVVPRVLFEDRDHYLFAMEAAPAAHVVWKQLLLEGRTDATIAARLGAYLATIHRQTADQPQWKMQFGDTDVFVQLRVNPFYRRIAEASAAARPHIERLVAEMFSLPICLVLADFSPKNVLVAGERIVLVDFETAHYGDPAFDVGFFLSHLLLKSLHDPQRFADFAALTVTFWETYVAGLATLVDRAPFAPEEMVRRTIGHVAGCMWSRIDGTSRIDYLNDREQQVVREFCLSVFRNPPANWIHLLAQLRAMRDSCRPDALRPHPSS